MRLLVDASSSSSYHITITYQRKRMIVFAWAIAPVLCVHRTNDDVDGRWHWKGRVCGLYTLATLSVAEVAEVNRFFDHASQV
jgi:hypothetical protein